jgi:hypothetical protein
MRFKGFMGFRRSGSGGRVHWFIGFDGRVESCNAMKLLNP